MHHVVERSEGGDDVAGNLLLLCGSGTTGCHGAWHGSPYLADVPGALVAERPLVERRDRVWVGQRLGLHIVTRRPDVAAYIHAKLGAAGGDAYMARRYGMATVTLEEA